MSKQIPELTIITTPTAGQESLIETVVARHDTYATSRMTLAQIFTLGSISGAIKSALDTLSGLISGNTSSINTLSSTKLNIAWGTRTGLTAKAVVATDASGNEVLITGTLWQQIGFDVSNTPVAITPTVDVHGLTQKTIPVGADEVIISDSEASFVNKKITLWNLFSFFWDGSDGSITISTNTTLTRDMYYINLTVNNGITLNPDWYKIYCTGTLTNNGTISRPWNVGGTGQVNNTGTPNTGWAALNQGTLGAELWGANSATNGTSANPCYSNVNAANGGRSNQSASVSTGGVSTRWTDYNVVTSPYRIALALAHCASSRQISSQYKWWSSAAGWTNDSNTWNGNTAYGWGGGWNGGTIFISAYAIVNNGTISSIWWAGGAWVSAYGTAFAWGGGGWSGWTVILIYVTITLWTVTTTGWAGWSASWWASTAWATWATWPVIQIAVTL